MFGTLPARSDHYSWTLLIGCQVRTLLEELASHFLDKGHTRVARFHDESSFCRLPHECYKFLACHSDDKKCDRMPSHAVLHPPNVRAGTKLLDRLAASKCPSRAALTRIACFKDCRMIDCKSSSFLDIATAMFRHETQLPCALGLGVS